MNRQQIATAQALFYERDRVERLLLAAESGKGLAVAITGDCQKEPVLAAVQQPLVDHFSAEVARIDKALKGLGWSGS